MSDFEELKNRAVKIREMYDDLNQQQRDRKWDAKDYAMGFVGDVGDLMKLVAAKEGMRAGADIDNRLGHELADCLWSVLVLAEYYGIDLKNDFERTMDHLEKRISKELS